MKFLTLTLATIHLLCFYLFLRTLRENKTLSPFYSKEEDLDARTESDKNLYRKAVSKHYLHNLNVNHSLLFHKNNLQKRTIDHLIVVVSEKPSDYKSDMQSKYILTQLVHSLDVNIRHDNSELTAMLICNRTTEPFTELEVLSKFYPVFLVPNPKKVRLKITREEKLKMDFISCANFSLNLMKVKPKYLSIIRDVVVPHQSFLPSLKYIIHNKCENTITRGEFVRKEKNSCFSLHLQEPVTFRAFAFDGASLVDLIVVTFCGAVLFFVYFKCIESKFVHPRKVTKICVIIVTYGGLLFILLALCVGRPYLVELRRIDPSFFRLYELPESITVSAVTMLVEYATLMIDHLSDITCSSYSPFKDSWFHAMYSFEKPGFVVSPSIVRYV